MSKSKYSDSNLYMNTREFADLVIQALHDQNYFKNNDVAHPQDIAIAFSTIAETIGNTMSWAIKQEHQGKKNAVMQTGNLKKSALPQDDEIAPILESHEDFLGYSEYRKNAGYL
jgi:hypothetical protein